MGFFHKNNAGKLAGSVTTDLSFVEMYAMKMIDTVVNGYISALTMVLCLAFYSIPVALIALAGIGMSALFLHLLELHSRKNAPTHQKAQDDMVVSATLEYIRGMPVVKAYGQGGVSIEGVQKAYGKSRNINIKIEEEYVPYNCLHLFSLKLASAIIVAVAAILTTNGTLTIPVFLMFAVFSFVIFGHVETINNAAHVLEIIEVTMNKLQKIEQAQFIDYNGQDHALSHYDIEMEHFILKSKYEKH